LCENVYGFQEKIFELSKYTERMDKLIKELDDIEVYNLNMSAICVNIVC